jgi:PAS domain-containing protein
MTSTPENALTQLQRENAELQAQLHSQRQQLEVLHEQLLGRRPQFSSSDTTEHTAELLEELQVYQEELRLQNIELREARNAMELSHSRYRSLFQFSPLPCLVVDRQQRVIELNDQARQLLTNAAPHFSPARMQLTLFLNQRSHPASNRHYDEVFTNAVPVQANWTLRNGKQVLVHSFLLPHYEEPQECQTIFLEPQNQETELRELQQELRQLRQLQQMTRVADWSWDAAGWQGSLGFYELLGMPMLEAEALFSAYLERIPTTERDDVSSRWQTILRERRPFALQHHFQNSAGASQPLNVLGMPDPFDASSPRRLIGTVQFVA